MARERLRQTTETIGGALFLIGLLGNIFSAALPEHTGIYTFIATATGLAISIASSRFTKHT